MVGKKINREKWLVILQIQLMYMICIWRKIVGTINAFFCSVETRTNNLSVIETRQEKYWCTFGYQVTYKRGPTGMYHIVTVVVLSVTVLILYANQWIFWREGLFFCQACKQLTELFKYWANYLFPLQCNVFHLCYFRDP